MNKTVITLGPRSIESRTQFEPLTRPEDKSNKAKPDGGKFAQK